MIESTAEKLENLAHTYNCLFCENCESLIENLQKLVSYIVCTELEGHSIDGATETKLI
jgi:hypothetical protein